MINLDAFRYELLRNDNEPRTHLGMICNSDICLRKDDKAESHLGMIYNSDIYWVRIIKLSRI